MVLVRHILQDAARRLAVIGQEAPVCEAAKLLANANTPLVVVCGSDGVAVGVVSGMDIVRTLSRSSAEALSQHVGTIMTTTIQSCHADQTLQSVWAAMGERALRCTPVLDSAGRPQGVVHARDIARALLNEVESEEVLLRDYVLGVGYQ
jgi:CBS domain-containing protein